MHSQSTHAVVVTPHWEWGGRRERSGFPRHAFATKNDVSLRGRADICNAVGGGEPHAYTWDNSKVPRRNVAPPPQKRPQSCAQPRTSVALGWSADPGTEHRATVLQRCSQRIGATALPLWHATQPCLPVARTQVRIGYSVRALLLSQPSPPRTTTSTTQTPPPPPRAAGMQHLDRGTAFPSCRGA